MNKKDKKSRDYKPKCPLCKERGVKVEHPKYGQFPVGECNNDDCRIIYFDLKESEF